MGSTPTRNIARALATLAILAGLATGPALALPKEKQRWIRVESANFTWFSHASERRTAAIARKLERLRVVLTAITGTDEPHPVPILIYLFNTDAGLVPYKRNPDGSTMNVSGYFSKTGDADYVAIDASVGPTVIYHEYLHAFMEQNVPNLPLWLGEGLAEFYATFKVDDEYARVGSPDYDHLAGLRRTGLIPLDELFRVETDSPDYNEGERQSTFYSQSWALTHYLLADEERRGRMGTYFERLGRGDDPVAALYDVYELEAASLQAALEAYVQQPRLNLFSYKFKEKIDGGDVKVSPMDYAEVLFRLGDLLAHRRPVLHDEAEKHLQAALEREPSRAETRVSLAHLRDLQQRYGDAAALYDEALELEPDNAHAWSRYGWSVLEAFYEAETGNTFASTPPAMLRARDLFRKSLELRDGHPETLVGFGKTFLFEEDAAEGIDALSRASRKLPSRTDVLTDLIVLLARTGQTAGARSLLERALRPRTRDPEMLEYAEESLIEAEFNHAVNVYNAGRQDEAVAMLRDVADRTENPALRRKVETRLLALTGAEVTGGDAVDVYNRAVSAASAGDLDKAIELLEGLLAGEVDEQLRRAAASMLDEVREVHKHNRHVARYNEAVGHFNAREYESAVRLLEQILSEDPDERIRESVEGLLADARRRARRR
jgi:tetratricopeptide (TPR) repeat protein